MITIQLNNASNGVIKKVVDTQYNGADQTIEIVTVYELNETEDKINYYLKVAEFLRDVSKDLGMHFGNDHDQIQLSFNIDWGDKYIPANEEIDEKIKDLKDQIKNLKEYKKLLDDNVDNI